jgi:hypothetical protein
MHAACPIHIVKRFGAQAVHDELPYDDEYVLSGHSMQLTVLLLMTLYVPGLQSLHTVCPVLAVAQYIHSEAPLFGMNDPAGQGVVETVPVQYEPGVQGSHV